ncbi:MAG TPA: hypothetical protein PKN33_20690 [Phycisphaerae bacterium]|nr:hypothetical protein [Phycisphaerae bacterium]
MNRDPKAENLGHPSNCYRKVPMNKWRPITTQEFWELFEKQYEELDKTSREIFENYRVPFWRATIRRSMSAGDESVIVVSQLKDGVLYFDDVEYGFNIGVIDETGRITNPGGSQYTLQEAISTWFSIS